MNMIWRPIDSDSLKAIIELSQTCYAVDGGSGYMLEPDDITSSYLPDEPNSGICAYTLGGQLAASASVSTSRDHGRQRARIVGQVHPGFRSKGIGTYLMQWSQAWSRVLLTGVAEPERLMEIATESLTEPAHRLFLAHGFTSVFEELVMQRDFQQPLPDYPLPQGVTLTNWQADQARQFYQVYSSAFRDRPGFPGYTVAEWIQRVTENDHKPEWSLLERIGGEPVGFVIGNVDLSKDPPGGEIWQIGVIPTHRRRGLASALLVETLRRMQEAGSSSVFLTVNINNPGAIKAYSRLGFLTVGRRARYERRMET